MKSILYSKHFFCVLPFVLLMKYGVAQNFDPDACFGGISFPYTHAINPCSFDGCNLIKNGGFEYSPTGCTPVDEYDDFNEQTYCWTAAVGSPDYFEEGCANVENSIPFGYGENLTYAWEGGGEHFIGIGGYWGTSGEAIQVELANALIPGQEYTISFHANQYAAMGASSLANLDICLASDLVDPIELFQQDFECGMLGTTSAISDVVVPVGEWSCFTFSFVYSGDGSDDVLILKSDLSAFEAVGGNYCYFLLDNIALVEGNLVEDLNLPSTICQSSTPLELEVLTDLDIYVGYGEGIQFVDGSWIFDPSSLGLGIVEITIGVIPDIECEPIYVCLSILVDGININLGGLNESICINANEEVVLSVDQGTNLNWTPSDYLNTTVGSPVTANPAETVTYIVTGESASGCEDSDEVTIYVGEFPIVTVISTLLQETEFCYDASFVYDVLQASGADYYTWESSEVISVLDDPEIGSNVSIFLLDGIGGATVTGYDSNGCSAQSTIEFVEYNPIEIASVVGYNSCFRGDIDINVSGGSGTYIFSWQNLPAGFDPNQEDQYDLPNGVYILEVTSEGLGCSETVEFEIESVICDTDMVISTNTVWNGLTETFCSNIIISNGAKLTIEENSTIRFAEDKGFILENGGDLEVENSTLTIAEGCPGFWKGIRSYKVANFPFDSDKCLISIESSTVSYAENALFLFTINTSNPASTNWIWSNVSNSLFLNNKQDFYCVGQQPKHLVHVTNGNSTFRIDEDFPEGYSSSPERALFKDFGKPVYFGNCVFENAAGGILAEQEITALHFKSAGFQFLSAATNTMGINSESKITGFTRAIKSIGDGRQTSLLMNTDISAWRGVYFQNVGLSSTDDCEFYNLTEEILTELGAGGQLTLNNSISYIFQENWDSEWAPYGMYVDGALNAFTVVDNYFSTAILPGITTFSHGFIGNNTGENANRLYRNTFQDMETAVKFQGDNRSNNSGQGVQIRCNSFGSNSNDIRVLGSNVGLPVNWGIPHQQSIDRDNNNSFTQSACAICEFDDIYNSTVTFIYRSTSEFDDPDPDESFGVIYPIALLNLECEEMDGFELKPGGDGSALVSLQLKTEEFLAKKDEYMEIVDDGITDDLVSLVQNTSYTDAIETYFELMQRSPNLSEKVLIESLEKYEIPNVLLALLLRNNPSASKNPEVQTKLVERPVSFDEFEMDLIRQAQEIMSYKDEIESELFNIEFVRSLAVYSLWFDAFIDSEIDSDNFSFLGNLNSLNISADCLMSSLMLLAMGSYDSARELLSSYILTNNGIDGLSDEVINGVIELIDLEQNANFSEQLAMDQIDYLESMFNYSDNLLSSWCQTILAKTEGFTYVEPVLIGDFENRRINSVQSENSLEYVISPNPAHGFISVKALKNVLNNAIIYDQFGGRVCSIQNVNGLENWIIDLSGLSEGLYTISLTNGSEFINAKFVKL
jgi:hypothetical protein